MVCFSDAQALEAFCLREALYAAHEPLKYALSNLKRLIGSRREDGSRITLLRINAPWWTNEFYERNYRYFFQ